MNIFGSNFVHRKDFCKALAGLEIENSWPQRHNVKKLLYSLYFSKNMTNSDGKFLASLLRKCLRLHDPDLAKEIVTHFVKCKHSKKSSKSINIVMHDFYKIYPHHSLELLNILNKCCTNICFGKMDVRKHILKMGHKFYDINIIFS